MALFEIPNSMQLSMHVDFKSWGGPSPRRSRRVSSKGNIHFDMQAPVPGQKRGSQLQVRDGSELPTGARSVAPFFRRAPAARLPRPTPQRRRLELVFSGLGPLLMLGVVPFEFMVS